MVYNASSMLMRDASVAYLLSQPHIVDRIMFSTVLGAAYACWRDKSITMTLDQYLDLAPPIRGTTST